MKLNNPLLTYQQKAVDKLIRLKVGALFMEQGTGKTITALEIARIRYERGKIDAVIWLCPCSAKQNIKHEIMKQCPFELRNIFTICGIETLSTSIRANAYLRSFCQKNRCFLIVDESLLVKNPRAYRTGNIMKLSQLCPYRMILNGTPISKNEADLYAQFYILDWRILGYSSYWSFAANHIEYDQYGRFRRVLNTEYLSKKIKPYTFQIMKSECMNLPDKRYHTVYFYLTDEQEEEYDRVAEMLIYDIDEWHPETIYRLFAGLQAVMSGKRLRFNKTGSHFESEEMFQTPLDNPRIVNTLKLLDEDKTIIFCHYESEITQLVDLLPDAVRFDGAVSQKERSIALEKFSREKKYLVANRNCAGFSLNLQFCHKIVYMSQDWNLGTRLQSEDRVHRLGQEHEVQIYDLCADNTLDERILNCLWNKESILDSLKKEVGSDTDGLKEAIKKYICGSKGKYEIFDASELEEENA